MILFYGVETMEFEDNFIIIQIVYVIVSFKLTTACKSWGHSILQQTYNFQIADHTLGYYLSQS